MKFFVVSMTHKHPKVFFSVFFKSVFPFAKSFSTSITFFLFFTKTSLFIFFYFLCFDEGVLPGVIESKKHTKTKGEKKSCENCTHVRISIEHFAYDIMIIMQKRNKKVFVCVFVSLQLIFLHSSLSLYFVMHTFGGKNPIRFRRFNK